MAKLPERELSVAEVLEAGKIRKTKPGLTVEEIADLEATYKDVATAHDDDAAQLRRAITAKLRRTTHAEFHPDCKDVEITVPQHPSGAYYTINEVPYYGRKTVHACVARQLASMIDNARQVERDRMRENGRIVDLDNPVAERIRQIQDA